jgi:hypothetical protein
MNTAGVLTLLFMVCFWGVTIYMIWKWGPGIRRRSVRCPEKNLRAEVLALQEEGDFNCLRVTDIKACSLVPGELLTCDRECMERM